MRRIALLTFALCCLLFTPMPSYAQEQPTESATENQTQSSFNQETDDLFQAYLALQEDIKALKSGVQELNGESQEALNVRILQLQLSGLDTLENLADLLISAKQADQDISEILAKVTPILSKYGPQIAVAIDKEIDAYQNRSSKVDEVSAEGLRLYLEHMNRLHIAYTALNDITLKNAELGIDDRTSQKFLIKHLSQRAETFIGLLELYDTKIAELDKLLKITANDQDLLVRKNILAERGEINIKEFRHTVNLLKQQNIDISQYQQYLVVQSGEITSDMLDYHFVAEIVNRWSNSIADYFANNGIELIFKILIFMLIIIAFRFLSNIVKRLLLRSLNASQLSFSSLMKDMVVSIASRLVMLLGLLIALSQLGISLGPLLAGLGVAGFIIGFALQDTLGNFASGLMILVYRPYDVKDMVEVGGVFGEVKSMNLVSTTILTVDNQTLVIPNSKIWGDVIKNVTAQRVRRIDMVFGIAYSDDIEHAERLFTDILNEHEKVLKSPEPNIRLHTLGESSVDFIVRPWVKTEDYWEVYWDVTREVKMRMDREGLNIPFPQRDIHIYQQPAALGKE